MWKNSGGSIIPKKISRGVLNCQDLAGNKANKLIENGGSLIYNQDVNW